MPNTRTPIKISDRIKWADPAVARDYWDDDATREENLRLINNQLNTLHVVTDIVRDKDGSVTMIEIDYATQILPSEAFPTNVVLSINTDPFLLQESLKGKAVVNVMHKSLLKPKTAKKPSSNSR